NASTTIVPFDLGIDLLEEGAREEKKNRKEDPSHGKERSRSGWEGSEIFLPPSLPSRDVMCTRTCIADPPVEWKWMNPYFSPSDSGGLSCFIVEGNAWEDVLPQGIVKAAL
ncbi:hypothetical protein CDAR_457971, partial [Caerostris darwini]